MMRMSAAESCRWIPRGVSYLICFIPLSFCFFLWGADPRWWGLLAGASLLIAAQHIFRWNSEWLSLLVVLGAGVFAYLSGYRIEFITHPDGGFFYLGIDASLLVTLGWIVLINQGFAVLGRLDTTGRLTAKVLLLAVSALLLISAGQGQFFGMMILGLLLIAVLWLQKIPVAQWNRAVGYVMALAAIAGLFKTTATLAIVAPLIVLGLPFSNSLAIAYSARLQRDRWDDKKLFALYALTVYGGVMAFLATRLIFAAWLAALVMTGALIVLGLWLRKSLIFESDLRVIRLLGTRIDRISLAGAVERLQTMITLKQGGTICTPDTTAVLRAQRDVRLRDIYERADLVTADGTGIVWASRLLGTPLPERVSGIDLLERFFSAPGRAPLRVFLLGAAPGVADAAAAKLKERFAHLEIVGTHHGYFFGEPNPHPSPCRGEACLALGAASSAPTGGAGGEGPQILQIIRQAQPELLLVGLGVPRQERWMSENAAALKELVLMGVGGSFDVWAGRLPRAPQRWRKLGLEWLYRVLQEPKRIVRVSAIPLFIAEVWALKLLRALE